MKRRAIIVDKSSAHGRVVFVVDVENASDILPYIFSDIVIEEFKQIRDIIKQNLRNREKYCKCDVSEKAQNMFEMRFTRNNRNDRIYCQEKHIGGIRMIIMSELLIGKKSQNIPKNIRLRIENMGGYDYEIK